MFIFSKNDGLATKKDIITDKNTVKVDIPIENINGGGIALINDGETAYVDNSNCHSLVIGSVGSGKSQLIVKPLINILAKNNENIVVTDLKNELFDMYNNYLTNLGYKVYNLTVDSEIDTIDFLDKTAIFINLSEDISKNIKYIPFIENITKNDNKTRLNIILDDFVYFPEIKDIDLLLMDSLNRNIKFTIIAQSFNDLINIYGEKYDYLVGNCWNVIYLAEPEKQNYEFIIKMGGKLKNGHDVFSVEYLQTLKLFDAIIFLRFHKPFVTSLTPNYKINWNNGIIEK